MLDRFKIIHSRRSKFEHTIFALPFAFTGALLALGGLPSLRQAFWIVVAMVGARSAAMGFNRWADRDIDAQRTPDHDPRASPGAVTPAQVWRSSPCPLPCSCSRPVLNPLSFKLAPLAIAIVFFYSYTKRFTFLSHAFLGLAIAGWRAHGRLDRREPGSNSRHWCPALPCFPWLVGFEHPSTRSGQGVRPGGPEKPLGTPTLRRQNIAPDLPAGASRDHDLSFSSCTRSCRSG